MCDYVVTICSEAPANHVPGKWTQCEECALEIYLSDSTIRAIPENLKSLPLKTLCLECGYKKVMKELPPILPLTEEQIKEVEMQVR